MNINWHKAALVIMAYFSMIILQACCNCPDPDLPYFDYKSIQVEVKDPLPISTDSASGFGFIIRPDSVTYLAEVACPQTSAWGLINTAQACDCPSNGTHGPKYSLAAINIYADSIFDTAITSGAPLNALFEIATTYNIEDRSYDTMPLDSIGAYTRELISYSEFILSSKSVPVTFERPYYFRIEIIKENGHVIQSTVGPLVWEH